LCYVSSECQCRSRKRRKTMTCWQFHRRNHNFFNKCYREYALAS
jgi:hypothetical protein